jgi:hypothetical protein
MSEEFKVVIPKEVFAALQWQDDGKPAICAVNQALANFEPKIVFSYHLSILTELSEVNDNGMPTPAEHELFRQINEHFDANIKADGNALFLARITWNGTCELIYRVYDPEVANAFLMDIVENDKQVRPFSFKMEQDREWELADWFLQHWQK